VLIGGGWERKTLRLTAEHADIWHGFGDAEVIAHKHRVLDEWCDSVGRSPALIERSAAVSDPPEKVGDGLLRAGTTLFTISVDGPDYDLAPVRDWITWRDGPAPAR
jgi:alkanesulfonate monooxygenase SsuD/methylene tetrahydromethanopterin reductase-like flavin-dependent oxidoreductase (luciferase family)